MGARPYSTNKSLPSGFKTLLISLSATRGSGTEQSVQVITTLSMTLSAKGRVTALPWTSDAAALAAEVHAKTLLIEKPKMQLAILRRARFRRARQKSSIAISNNSNC